MQGLLSRWGAAGLALTGVAAFAQAPLPSSAPTAVPSGIEYRSAFERYRAYREPEAGSWRESNEEAATLGGHAGHIKSAETQQTSAESKPEAAGAAASAPAARAPSLPAPPPAATAPPGSAASPATKPASPGHAGHGK